jgi:photosystem II stability/assembly factor-like uncharacterized protein
MRGLLSPVAGCGLITLLLVSSFGQSVAEFPPYLLPTVEQAPLCGGRTIAIAVKPGIDSEIVFSTEFGGLWKTTNGGINWRHLSNLTAIWAKDVAYAEDDTLIATVQATNKVIDDSGIWVSRDGGDSWAPADFGWHGPANGISVAPDNRRKIYVATDFGVATSTDNGGTWTHTQVDGRPRSIVALARNRAVLLSKSGVFRLTPDGTWDNVFPGDFVVGDAFKQVDAWPGNLDKIFVLKDYDHLYLYEMGANRFTAIEMPAVGRLSRNPFVRISARPGGASGFEIWAGTGVQLLRRTCANIEDAVGTGRFNWASFSRYDGLHDDTGFLALNSAGLPLLFGSDGGVFKPTDSSSTHWERAAVRGSGLNSYQITALGGTEYTVGDLSLYFATQDNGSLWSSPDGGINWPRASSPEGQFVQVAPYAHDPSAATVAWNSIRPGDDPRWSSMFANGNLEGEREVPANVPGSRTGYLSDFTVPYYINRDTWVRYRSPHDGRPEIYISRDNGDHWGKIAEIEVALRGLPKPASAGGRDRLYVPFTASPGASERIGLIRLDLRTGAMETIYLPDDGSLGIRATNYDHSAVFGVDPLNPDFIIAPDIKNSVIKVTRNGGRTWQSAFALKNLVTRSGVFRLGTFNAHDVGSEGYGMEVTTIYFDPFDSHRILIGTRETGIIWSGDQGRTWARVPDSEKILYCTGFFMTRNNEGYASSYGRGLWKLDFRTIRALPTDANYCPETRCNIRLRGDPDRIQSTLTYDIRNAMVVRNGHINGLKLGKDGQIELITISPGSNFVRYLDKSDDSPALPVKENDQGIGFDDEIAAQAALKNNEVVNGIVMQNGRLQAIVSSASDFIRLGFAQVPSVVKRNEPPSEVVDKTNPPFHAIEGLWKKRPRSNLTGPQLVVTTSIPSASLPILGSDGILWLWAAGMKPNSEFIGAQLAVSVDDRIVNKDMRFGYDGIMSTKIRMPESLDYGTHRVALVAGGKPILHAVFVKGYTNDAEKRSTQENKLLPFRKNPRQ